MDKESAQRIGLIVLTGAVLGSSVVMTRVGVSEIAPLSLVLLRLVVATLGFAITLLLFKRNLPREARIWLDIAIVGITNAGIPLVFFTIALQFISSAVLTIFIALVPLFTGLMAHVWLEQEKLTRVKIAGLVAAFVGVLVLLLTGTTGLAQVASGLDVRGQILALIGAVVGAVSGVYTRLKLRGTDVIVVTAGQFAVGLLVVAPFALALSSLNVSAITLRGWFSVVYTGIIGSFIGFLLVFYMIKRFGATIASLPTYVMPAVSAALGVVILSEVVTPPLLAGASLILFGVFLASR